MDLFCLIFILQNVLLVIGKEVISKTLPYKLTETEKEPPVKMPPHVATFSNDGHKGKGNYATRKWLVANDPGKSNWCELLFFEGNIL